MVWLLFGCSSIKIITKWKGNVTILFDYPEHAIFYSCNTIVKIWCCIQKRKNTNKPTKITSSASISSLPMLLLARQRECQWPVQFSTLSVICWRIGPGFLSTPPLTRRERSVSTANKANMACSFRSLARFAAFVARLCNIDIKIETKRPITVLYVSVAHPMLGFASAGSI